MKRLLISVAACVLWLGQPAAAVPIDFSQVITDLDGRPILEGDKPITLARAATFVLLGQYDDEKALSGEVKVKRFALGLKINAGGTIDLSIDEIKIIKDLAGKGYNALLTGRIWQMLDPASVK